MPQHSKVLRSRDAWKRKAVRRAQQLREYRKTQRRHQRKIAQLQAHISALEQTAPVKEGALAPAAAVSDLTDAQQVRTLCVLLVLHSVVSFRSVPRILGLLQRAKCGRVSAGCRISPR
jgi:hypothetical protein